MYELIYLAFLSDSSRVANSVGRENEGRSTRSALTGVEAGAASGLTHEGQEEPNGWKNLGTLYSLPGGGMSAVSCRNPEQLLPSRNATEICGQNTFACMARAFQPFPPLTQLDYFRRRQEPRRTKVGISSSAKNEDNQAAREERSDYWDGKEGGSGRGSAAKISSHLAGGLGIKTIRSVGSAEH